MSWLKRGLVLLAVLIGVGLVYDLVRGNAAKERPNIVGKTLSGKTWSLADYRGRSPVLVNFFATWCGPCRLEFPRLVEIHQKYADRGLQVVLISPESLAVVRATDLTQAPLTILADGADIHKAYGVESIPHTILFDAGGQVVVEIPGYNEAAMDGIDQRLAQMMPRSAAGSRLGAGRPGTDFSPERRLKASSASR
jgi:thiol-disulfide isomerase/thioredoxin